MIQDNWSFLCFVLSCDTRDLIFWYVGKDSYSSMLTVWLVSNNDFRGIWQTDLSIKRKMAILLHSASLQISLENHCCRSTKNSFQKIKRKHMAKNSNTGTDSDILSSSWWIGDWIWKGKKLATISLKKSPEKLKQGKKSRESNVAKY